MVEFMENEVVISLLKCRGCKGLHPPQPQTRAYLQHRLQVGPHRSGHHQQHVWQGQVNQFLSGANVDITVECHRRSKTSAVILETVSLSARFCKLCLDPDYYQGLAEGWHGS